MHSITDDVPPERLRPTTLVAAGITEADLQGWIITDDPWSAQYDLDHNMRAFVCVVLGNIRSATALTTHGT